MAPKAGNLRLTCNLCALFLKNKFLYPLDLVKYENLFFFCSPHNPEVVGSNSTPATTSEQALYRLLRLIL